MALPSPLRSSVNSWLQGCSREPVVRQPQATEPQSRGKRKLTSRYLVTAREDCEE
jgi:hypothetical protein